MSRRRRQSAPPSLRGGGIFAERLRALRHGNDGAGGLKVNGGDFGTVFAANLTSDRDTGIGAWSDAEISRAIRSGVNRDGRPLFLAGDQRRAPGVQHGGEADPRAQMLRVGGDGGQCLRGRREQEVVDPRLVVERDGADRRRG